MKKFLQKTVAIALTGAMVIGALSGCNKETSKENETTTKSQQTTTQGSNTTETTTAAPETTTQSQGSAVAGIDGWEPFASNVTITIPVYDRGKEGVPPVTENYWTKWIQENFGDKYNITVEFEAIPRGDVLNAYALLAVAEDLPTILMEYDYPKLAQWVDDGYLTEYDLNEFAQIAPTYYQRMVDNNQIGYTEINDGCYFALAERPYYNTNYTFITWVRMDWLEQVGYDHIPANRAEYLDAMAKIKEAGLCEYPGGGSMISGTAGVDQNYAYRDLDNMTGEEWAMYGDYAIPALSWEPQYKLLKFANEDYNLGITNPEFYSLTAEEDQAAFIAGNKYSHGSYISATMDWLKSFYEQNPDAKLAVAVQSLEADTEAGTVPAFRSNNPFGMMIGFSSQASADEIKAAMMYMEWMTIEENLFTMQWGIEGENYTMGADGLPVSVADYDGDYKQGFNNSKDYWCVTVEARTAGTIEDVIKAASPVGLPQDFTQDIIDNYYNQVAAWEKGWVVTDCMFAKSIESATEYQQTLLDKYAEFRTKLTTCKPEEFDALYEQYAKEYLEAGYQAIADERLEKYNDGYSSKMN